MDTGKPKRSVPTLRDVLERRQAREPFVGRQDLLATFQKNLTEPPDSEERRFVFSVHGQGGVGKTFLLRRFQEICRHGGVATTWVDHTEPSPVGVMTAITAQLAPHGLYDSAFRTALARYETLVHEIGQDASAPPALAGSIGGMFLRAGITAAKLSSVGRAAVEIVGEQNIEHQTAEWTRYLSRKLKTRSEIELVRDPVSALSKHFTHDLNTASDSHAGFVLFFDNYEYTSPALDPWLRALLQGDFGDINACFVFCIAGREALSRAAWADLEGLVIRMLVSEFTEDEARQLLAERGLLDEEVANEIISLSRGLPLLIAAMADAQPSAAAEVDNPSSTAVERILRWDTEPKTHDVILRCSVAKVFNRDVVSSLFPDEAAGSLFESLRKRPFVQETREGWTMHSVVRQLLNEYFRRESPREWRSIHLKLARHYSSIVEARSTAEMASPDRQRGLRLLTYHRLCAEGESALPMLVNRIVEALREGDEDEALAYGSTLRAAATDCEDSGLVRVAEVIAPAFDELRAGKNEPAIAAIGTLLGIPDTSERDRARLLYWRSKSHFALQDFVSAEADLSQAISLEARSPVFLAYRGFVRRQVGQFNVALADIDQVIALEPRWQWAKVERALILRLMERRDDAVDAIFETTRMFGETAEALMQRATCLRELGRHEEAIVDLRRALELDPSKEHEIRKELGECFSLLRDVRSAKDNLLRALEIEAGCSSCWKSLISLIGPDDASLAAALDEQESARSELFKSWESRSGRGLALTALGFHDLAIAELSAALDSNPGSIVALCTRSRARLETGDIEGALKDARKMVEIDPGHAHNGFVLANALLASGLESEAFRCLERIAAKHPGHAHVAAKMKGEWLLERQRELEALRCFRVAIRLEPECPECWVALANTASTVGGWGQVQRIAAEVNGELEHIPAAAFIAAHMIAAKGDFEIAVALGQAARPSDPELAKSATNELALWHGRLGRFPEALKLLGELEPIGDELHVAYNRVVLIWRGLGHESAAVEHDHLVSRIRDREFEGEAPIATEYAQAGLAALRGQDEQALARLSKALEGAALVRDWVRIDCAWDELRNNPAFVRLVGG